MLSNHECHVLNHAVDFITDEKTQGLMCLGPWRPGLGSNIPAYSSVPSASPGPSATCPIANVSLVYRQRVLTELRGALQLFSSQGLGGRE